MFDVIVIMISSVYIDVIFKYWLLVVDCDVIYNG